LPHRDFFADDPSPLSNLLGYREDLGAKSVGVLGRDPRTVS